MATAHFNEENSADIVTGQNVDAKDERLREVMDVVIRHLHAAVKEIEPYAGGMDAGHPVPNSHRP